MTKEINEDKIRLEFNNFDKTITLVVNQVKGLVTALLGLTVRILNMNV